MGSWISFVMLNLNLCSSYHLIRIAVDDALSEILLGITCSYHAFGLMIPTNTFVWPENLLLGLAGVSEFLVNGFQCLLLELSMW